MRQTDQRFQQVETQYNAGGDIHLYRATLSLTQQQLKRNRALMLERVQVTWIEGVLEPSLHGAASIALDLQSKPSVTVTPFWQVLREFDHTMPLPQSLVTLVQVYDHASGEVLILGEPGAGKTTLLLELTRDLLGRARQDERQPMPVVFNLSSWALSRQPLYQWLARELHVRYQIPQPVATSWIESDQVLPLLDGLDEVAAAHREACIEAINAYRRAHGLVPTVVCCRKDDYLALSNRLLLRTAVVVQPLTRRQIETSLTGAGEETSMLQRALHEDAELQTLASTPLMLNVLTVAYQGIPAQERATTGSLDFKREQIFASYVQRVLNRRGSALSSMQEQIIWWLTTLARQMKKRGQTVFYIEQIQPDWLPGPRWNWIYDNLAVLLPGVLIGVLVYLLIYSLLFSFSNTWEDLFFFIFVGGLIGGLFSGSQRAKPPGERKEGSSRSKWHHFMPLCCGLLVGLGLGLNYHDGWNGLVFGVSSAMLCLLFGKRAGPEMGAHGAVWSNMWPRLVKAGHLRNGVLCLGVFGLSYLFYNFRHPSERCSVPGRFWIHNVLSEGAPDVLACGVVGILLSIILLGGCRNIQPAEVIVWSWRSLWRSIFNRRLLMDAMFAGGVIGLSLGLSFGLADGLGCGRQGFDLMKGFTSLKLWGLSSWLSYSLCYWLLIGLVQGVASNTLEEQHRLMPNQGIRNSFRNGIVLGLVSAMVGLFVYFLTNFVRILAGGSSSHPSWLCQVVPNSPDRLCQITSDYPINILFLLLGSGLLMGLLTGGLACLRHALLRLLLWCAGLMPWNYARFLDAAAECILVRKVGGGYIFLHQLLLDYFAALGPGNLAPIGVLPVPQGGQAQGTVPTAPDEPSPLPAKVPVQEILSDSTSSSLTDTTVISNRRHLSPCGHKQRGRNARFCSVCGAPIKV